MPRTRTRWWTELPLIVVVYTVYTGGRQLARGDVTTSVDHGLALLRAERTLRIDLETPLNRLFTDHLTIGLPAAFAYATLHYLVTPALLVWLWRRRPAHYRVLRTWLLTATLLGLIGFSLFPTCPPRLLDPLYGFVDTMAQYGSYGWWGNEASAPRGLGGLTNQYAAMPSLHVGWSLWCGIALWRHGDGRSVRALAVSYPLLTTVVVLGTANHYVLDAVAGGVTMGVGLLLTRPVLGLTDRLRDRLRAGRAARDGVRATSGPTSEVPRSPSPSETAEAPPVPPAPPLAARVPQPAPAPDSCPVVPAPLSPPSLEAAPPVDRSAPSAFGTECQDPLDTSLPRPWRGGDAAADDTSTPASL